MPADPRLLSDEELTAARSRHVQVFGWSMEPDPTNPGTMRQTTYCRFCARDDDLAPAVSIDWRWPCLAGRVFDHITAQADIIRELTAERDRLAAALKRVSDGASEGDGGGWEISLATMDVVDAALVAVETRT
jgi:hypothetical protein